MSGETIFIFLKNSYNHGHKLKRQKNGQKLSTSFPRSMLQKLEIRRIVGRKKTLTGRREAKECKFKANILFFEKLSLVLSVFVPENSYLRYPMKHVNTPFLNMDLRQGINSWEH